MSDINFGFRSVAFLLLSSICFTSLVQHVGLDTALGSYYIEHGIDPTSNPRYTYDYYIPKYNINTIPDLLAGNINVTVNSTCEDRPISMYNAFLSRYLLRPEENLDWVSSVVDCSDLIRCYDTYVNFSLGSGLSYIPGLAPNGSSIRGSKSSGVLADGLTGITVDKSVEFSYEEFLYGELLYQKLVCKITKFSLHVIVGDTDVYYQPSFCKGLLSGTIVGINLGVGVVAVVLFLARCLYNRVYRSKKAEAGQAPTSGVIAGELEGITVDKAVEFSFEELSKATHDFSDCNKIGQGGFGSVYYAELRGEKAAIKKMDMKASKEFLAELRVLTHVHHLNLVRLIGYCVEGSHFLVYEYIENGNLSQHLHGSGREPLPWSTRVQIALDAARGLEYIHEYTIPVFIHCDIKSANILIGDNFDGKVADFGLTRLTAVGSRSRLVGTFGYMPPEYAQYGDVSPKVDVYAFGVVLYELISAKQAVIRGASDSNDEPIGLVALFDEVLSQADPKDDLVKMIDPRLGDDYPLDSVHKMAQLAKACTHVDPQRRPSMRSIVVALMALSTSTEE